MIRGDPVKRFASPDPRAEAAGGRQREASSSSQQHLVPAMVLPRWESLEAFSSDGFLDPTKLQQLSVSSSESSRPKLTCSVSGASIGGGECILAMPCGHMFSPQTFEAFLRRRWAELAANTVDSSETEQIPCPKCGMVLQRKDVHTLTENEVADLVELVAAQRRPPATLPAPATAEVPTPQPVQGSRDLLLQQAVPIPKIETPPPDLNSFPSGGSSLLPKGSNGLTQAATSTSPPVSRSLPGSAPAATSKSPGVPGIGSAVIKEQSSSSLPRNGALLGSPLSQLPAANGLAMRGALKAIPSASPGTGYRPHGQSMAVPQAAQLKKTQSGEPSSPRRENEVHRSISMPINPGDVARVQGSNQASMTMAVTSAAQSASGIPSGASVTASSAQSGLLSSPSAPASGSTTGPSHNTLPGSFTSTGQIRGTVPSLSQRTAVSRQLQSQPVMTTGSAVLASAARPMFGQSVQVTRTSRLSGI